VEKAAGSSAVEKKLERISETFMKLKIKVKSTIFSIAF